jgi:hypothetical protein
MSLTERSTGRVNHERRFITRDGVGDCLPLALPLAVKFALRRRRTDPEVKGPGSHGAAAFSLKD